MPRLVHKEKPIMKKKQSSESALGVAAFRAIESMRPEKDRVINDPYAWIFLDDKTKKWIGRPSLLLIAKFLGGLKFPGFRNSIIARVRFMNECIRQNFPGDFTQLVLLGAGYDMSGWCFGNILKDARIFEVDHPQTQKDKLEKLKANVTDAPDNIVYVPVDFETDNLKQKLVDSGYATGEKTLFIWEGVTCYLEKESVEQTLDFIVEHSAKGSRLAFDYLLPEVVDGISKDKLTKSMHNLVKEKGEPFKFGISPADIEDFLMTHGFSGVEKYSAFDIREAHFHGNNAHRKVSHLFNFVCAVT